MSFKSFGFKGRVTNSFASRIYWKVEPKRVIVPYAKVNELFSVLFLSTAKQDNFVGIWEYYLPRLNTFDDR